MSRYLIIGGTGTLGSAIAARLTSYPYSSISIFSRDELKQSEMRRKYPDARFVLGDIRDYSSVKRELMRGYDTVFHVAALKQVDNMERNVEECIKTNVQGTINVANAAIESCIPHVLFSSTDKAVLPINAYGYAKGLSERLLLSLNESQEVTKFCVYRWGNVIGSRGSAIRYFIDAIKAGKPVEITDKQMSRFWIRIESAVEFMVESYHHRNSNDVLIPPRMKAAPVTKIVSVIAAILGKPSPELTYVGIRPGEKIHECLYSSHDFCLRSDNGPQFSDQELIELLEPIVKELS